MRVLLDLNLSPSLCQQFEAAGHEAIHWSTIGELTASDDIVMSYARQNGLVLITHDLDFGALLAATRAKGPSVVQLRTQATLADTFVKLISATLTRLEAELSSERALCIPLSLLARSSENSCCLRSHGFLSRALPFGQHQAGIRSRGLRHVDGFPIHQVGSCSHSIGFERPDTVMQQMHCSQAFARRLAVFVRCLPECALGRINDEQSPKVLKSSFDHYLADHESGARPEVPVRCSVQHGP